MAFDGNESQQISLADATNWTTAYRQNNPGAIKAHFFGINKINEILDQPGCVGIRAYYAIDDNNKRQLVLVGANADEEDLYNGVILDKSVLCPTNCDQNSPLQ